MHKKLLIGVFLNIAAMLIMTSCGVKKTDNVRSETPTGSVAAVETAVTAPTEKPTLNTVPWGEDSFTALLPECTFGAVTQITSGEDMCLVVIEQIDEIDAVAYMDKLASSGFSCMEESSDLYTAGRNYINSSGVSINVVYSSNIVTLMIQK